jgi:hypothetical protein
MIDSEQAIAFIRAIPAVAVVYNSNHDPFIHSLLEATKGQLPVEEDKPHQYYYRVWFAAYRYLQQSPELFRVKKHDRTELGSYESPLTMLLEQQAAEDRRLGLLIPVGQSTAAPADHYTVSVRTTTEF